MGATSVRICDDESGRTWEAPLSDFLGGASFALDRGFGKQRALALNSPAWKKGLN
jgi:hypothetical protein